MSSQQPHNGGQKVKREAIITDDSIVALCPLAAVCVCRDTATRRKLECGYYGGSITNGNGSTVVCEYVMEDI
jgi:hypothetical protein